jgi:hypothetical protein
MRYAWKVSRLRHLIFDSDNAIVLGGRAMALHRHHKPIRGKVVPPRPRALSSRPVGALVAYRGPSGPSHPSRVRRACRTMCRLC